MNRQRKDIFKFLKAGIVCLFLCFLFSISLVERLNAEETPNIRAVKINETIQIDGKLLESVWQKAQPVTNFAINNTGILARVQTIAYILYDDSNLYFGFKCLEPDVKNIKTEKRENEKEIFADDCIEIMIDPWFSKDEYFHFAVNASGSTYDSYCSQGGSAQAADWNGGWEAKTFIGENYWSAEVSIPYSILGLNEKVTSTWGINLTREKKLPFSENSSIGQDGVFHVPAKFARLGGLTTNLVRYFYRVGAPSISTEAKDEKLNALVAVSIKNQTGKEQEVKVQCWLVDPGKNPIIKSDTVTLQPGEETKTVIGPFALSVSGEYDCHIILSDPVTQKTLYLSNSKQKIAYVPMAVRIIEPSYRDTIFASQNLKNIVTRVTVRLDPEKLKNYRLQANLMTAEEGNVLESIAVMPLKKNETEIGFSAARLAAGSYLISVTLYDEKNNEVENFRRLFSKVPSLPGEVRVDRNLNLLIDGKPVLVRGYFIVATEDMEKVSKEGSNVIQSYNFPYWSPEEGKAFLDTAQKNNLKVLICPWGSDKDMRSGEPRLSEEAKKGIMRQVNLYKNHPALLGWYMYDEPEILSQPMEKLKETYELIKKLDPYHPCVMLNNSLEGIATYEGCADILMPDPYPLFVNKGGFISPITKISVFMDRCRESAPDKPAWITLQAFDVGDEDETCSTQRAPDFKEFRAMVYLAIIHGAKGFLHFAYPYSIRHPNLRIGIPFIASELNFLAPAILFAEKRKVEVLPEKSGVEAVAGEYQGRFYIIAVNATPENKRVEFRLPDLGRKELKVVSENRSLKFTNEKFTDSFEGYEVHIYTTADDLPASTIKQVQATIDVEEALRRKKGNLAVWMENDVIVKASSWTHSSFHDAPRMAVNGVIDENGGEGWRDAKANQFPDWIQIIWSKTQRIGRVILYGINLRDYEVQYWNGNGWAVLRSVKGNDKNLAVHQFTPVLTDQIRVWITAANDSNSVISEIECYSE
ncbi:MAG: discoidin domain-containing protein [Candidatus Omnitrophota bacterium]